MAAQEVAPPPRPVLYFPTRVGDAWIYLHTDAQGKKWEIAEEVTAVEQKNGTSLVTVGRTHTDGKVYPNRAMQVSDRGVVRTTDPEFGRLAAPWVYLKLSHKPGQSWVDEINDPDTTRKAHEVERVMVAAGEFEAIRVEQRRRGKPDAGPVMTEWYAPGRGIVKLTTPGVTIEMKSFTPGK